MPKKPKNIHTIIPCLLIPTGGGQLLLPSAVVAEISPYHEPEPVMDGKFVSVTQPNWLLGIINWRNQPVPLLSIEEALSLPAVASVTKKHTVILYGLEDTQTMPFYALRAIDMPRTAAVTAEKLTELSAELHKGLVFKAEYNVVSATPEEFWLPDLSYLENLLIKLDNK